MSVLSDSSMNVFFSRCCFVLVVFVPALPGTEESDADGRELARMLVSPWPATSASIRLGRKHYLRLCQNCHGKDGRALDNFDFEATDLTAPERYLYGSSDGEIFFSIREGAGLDMPAFEQKLDDAQTWELVDFIRSIGPESERPPKEKP